MPPFISLGTLVASALAVGTPVATVGNTAGVKVGRQDLVGRTPVFLVGLTIVVGGRAAVAGVCRTPVAGVGRTPVASLGRTPVAGVRKAPEDMIGKKSVALVEKTPVAGAEWPPAGTVDRTAVVFVECKLEVCLGAAAFILAIIFSLADLPENKP